MEKLKLKVCGMKYRSNLEDLEKVMPDYIGFIFYKGSKRFAGEELKTSLLTITKRINRVGVFVNEKTEEIIRIAKEFNLNFIQLHGDELPETCKELKNHGISVIKAFSIAERFDFNKLNAYKPFCDFFLFDTKGENFGGTGKKFDWKILEKYDNEIPFFLSGGIGTENIEEIKNLTGLNIHAVDINSRFEKEPGLKDILMIKDFKNKIGL